MFSATASFAASGVLIGASVITLSSMKGKSARLFALIPLLFAVQQVIEGFQWLAVSNGTPNLALGYAFLLFAHLIWPIFLPLAALEAEADPLRRKLIMVCLALGIFSSAVLGYALLTEPLVVTGLYRTIHYAVEAPFDWLLPFTYVISVVGSGLLVKRYWIQMFALLGLFGLIVSFLMYTEAFASVWCFFAAVLSLCVIMELRSSLPTLKKKHK